MRFSTQSLAKTLLFFSPTIIFLFYTWLLLYEPFGTNNTYQLYFRHQSPVTTKNLTLFNQNSIKDADNNQFTFREPVFMKLQNIPTIDEYTILSIDANSSEIIPLEYTIFRTDRYPDPHNKELLTWNQLTFPNHSLFAQSEMVDILSRNNPEKIRTINQPLTEWITENISEGSTIGLSTGIDLDYERLSVLPNNLSTQNITIPWTIRGTVAYYVYIADQTVSFSFTKEDINRYEGEDTYTIILENLQNKEIFYRVIGDDGITDNSYLRSPQLVQIETPVPSPGIYKLYILNNQTTGARQISFDSTIHSMNIIASGIVTDSTLIHFTEPTEGYFHSSVQPQIQASPHQQESENATENNLAHSQENGLKSVPIIPDTRIQGVYLSPTPEVYFQPFMFYFTQISPEHWITPPNQTLPTALLLQNQRQSQVGIGIRVKDNGSELLESRRFTEIIFQLQKPSYLSR